MTKKKDAVTEESGKSTSQDTSAPVGEESKKSQIVALYLSGMHEVEDLSMVTGSRPSYIANVLRDAGLEEKYFDLYTSTRHPMNVYSKFFSGKLGFKDLETAEESVEHVDKTFKQFALGKDRAGQHHAMMMALTMGNRAHWTGKHQEATVFREWLIEKLQNFNLESEQILEEREAKREAEEAAAAAAAAAAAPAAEPAEGGEEK